MACMSETAMLCEKRSTRLRSTVVEQTYTELELPYSHLSLLPSVPRFSISLSDMSTKSWDVSRAISCSTPASTSCSPITSPFHNFESAMPTNEYINSASQLRPQKWYGQRVLVLPRSASAVDLQAQPRSRFNYGSRLRPTGPSVGNIRDYAGAALCEEGTGSLANCHKVEYSPHDLPLDKSHDEKRMRRKLHYKSYQEFHILSMYQDDSSAAISKLTDPQSACTETSEPEEASSIYSDSDTSGSGNSSPFPRTPEEDEFPSERSASSREYQKIRDMKRRDARQVHVIEHRQNKDYSFEADGNEGIPMQATVLTVPGKPRLIQIHRPQHTDHSCIEVTSTIDSTFPSTPKRGKQGASTFSPYSEATGTPFSDISHTASEATPTPKMAPRLSIRTDLKPLAYQPPSVCDTIPRQVTGSRSMSKQLADPFGSPASIDSSTTIGTLFAQESPPNPVNSSAEGPASEKPLLHNLYADEMYEAKIRDSITYTMKAFDALAASNFTVQSEEFSYFRTQHLNASIDETIAASIRSIFPSASSFSRSTLAAWLVVDLHFKQLFSELPSRPPSDGFDVTLSEYFVPTYEKTSYSSEQPLSAGRVPTDRSSPKLYEHPLTSLGPDCIPSKARSVLGIHTDPADCKAKSFRYTHRRVSRNILENQARSVHEGVQTLGRKLVRDLLSPLVTPDSAVRQKGMRVLKSRSSPNGQSSSPSNECLGDSARALWTACQCIVSMA